MPQQKQSIKPRCVICGDEGWRPAKPGETGYFDEQHPVFVPCEACIRSRIDSLRARLQIVSNLTDQEGALRLKDIQIKGRPDTEKMLHACRDMLEKKSFMLTIWGSNGNAKSAALVVTVNEFLDLGIPAIYLPAYDMLNWIQDAYNSAGHVISESAYDRLESLKSIRMLALDEFQSVKATDWRMEQLRNIIDRRWRDGLDGKSFTLLAMNEDPASLEPRIYSRLRDGRNCDSGEPIILNNDPDMRPLLRRKGRN